MWHDLSGRPLEAKVDLVGVNEAGWWCWSSLRLCLAYGNFSSQLGYTRKSAAASGSPPPAAAAAAAAAAAPGLTMTLLVGTAVMETFFHAMEIKGPSLVSPLLEFIFEWIGKQQKYKCPHKLFLPALKLRGAQEKNSFKHSTTNFHKRDNSRTRKINHANLTN